MYYSGKYAHLLIRVPGVPPNEGQQELVPFGPAQDQVLPFGEIPIGTQLIKHVELRNPMPVPSSYSFIFLPIPPYSILFLPII